MILLILKILGSLFIITMGLVMIGRGLIEVSIWISHAPKPLAKEPKKLSKLWYLD